MMHDMMNGLIGGGMWLWTIIGILVVVLLVVLIGKVAKEQLGAAGLAAPAR